MAGAFLGIFVHPSADVQITPKNRESWIGAWWLGFAVFAVFSLVVGIFMLGFPARVKSKDKEVRLWVSWFRFIACTLRTKLWFSLREYGTHCALLCRGCTGEGSFFSRTKIDYYYSISARDFSAVARIGMWRSSAKDSARERLFVFTFEWNLSITVVLKRHKWNGPLTVVTFSFRWRMKFI